MVPTLEVGQRVLVNRIGTHFGDPKVGDILVFHPPAGAEASPPSQCGDHPPQRRRLRPADAHEGERQLHQARRRPSRATGSRSATVT